MLSRIHIHTTGARLSDEYREAPQPHAFSDLCVPLPNLSESLCYLSQIASSCPTKSCWRGVALYAQIRRRQRNLVPIKRYAFATESLALLAIGRLLRNEAGIVPCMVGS